MKNVKLLKSLLICVLSVGFMTGCEDEMEALFNDTGIPDNSKAEDSPYVNPAEVNANIPNVGISLMNVGGHPVVNMTMTGIYDKQNGTWLDLQGTMKNGQNIWIEIDGVPRSLKAERLTTRATSNNKLDLVFLVDNSGSMSQEADSLAASILDWSDELAATFDLKLGCVGYNGSINGAIDMTTPAELHNYLGRSYGTYRTVGFEGTNADDLQTKASDYYTWGECGAAALHFSDDNFAFRASTTRLYVNFTDEPNQPASDQPEFSVESVSSSSSWGVHQGTIHTVFSEDTTYCYFGDYDERPWLMSEYTGGETMFVPSNFSGVSLSNLTVTDALRNACNIQIHLTDDLKSGTHDMEITIVTPDRSVQAVRTYTGVSFSN